MRLSPQHLYPIMALAALAAGSIWLERISTDPNATPEPKAMLGPDVIVEHMALTRFDLTGTPQYYIDAQQMRHLPAQAQSELIEPIVRYERDGMHLRLTADHGVTRDDGERVDLKGQVRAQRTLPDKPESTFTSDTLVLWPNTEQAKSIDPVVLTQDGAVVYSKGMTADNLFGEITLTGGVVANLPIKRKQP
ncbi:LPS export ABC transporter periplasmic protein LptC [Denitromonas ohlonensis]|uniref:LPS export ABC transporter periplasmic protein LptC n=2 Tax=Denitromonas TaxID=139331 RepID=A0A557RBB8_9RHOO|nr:LPS export ABC transporter periplasmic protein LptC [Denitromonas ohlonensis]TVO62447.1 LPS export ABC transporter periplasmic protein LptC [Denitromonas ohlonensis]TVO72302.1 LPS export ABC transporter periplasmic protein LptC [Denitromonas ohlonensis]